MRRIELQAEIEELQTLALWVEGICTELGISPSTAMNINLALEEVATNVVRYAYENTPKPNTFVVEFATDEEDRLVWRVTDRGIAFDPTAQKEADVTLSAEERPIGGLGIFLVKRIMDEVTYERKDGSNILTMRINKNKQL